jgi:hypothetical protein
MLPQHATVILMRIQYAHRQPEMVSDYPNGLQKIRVVRNEDSQLIKPLESVVKKMGSEIYV